VCDIAVYMYDVICCTCTVCITMLLGALHVPIKRAVCRHKTMLARNLKSSCVLLALASHLLQVFLNEVVDASRRA
jgi:hypothetical protein